MTPNTVTEACSTEVQRLINWPELFRHRLGHLLSAGLVVGAVSCGGNVDDSDDAGPDKTYFTCEASGDESPVAVHYMAVNPMYTSETLEPVQDTNPDLRVLDLDHTGEAPLDQSSYYKCEFQGGENCFFTVNPLPNTMYEAAHLETPTYIKWRTNWALGETTPLGSDEPLAKGDVALVHVLSNPPANGSYPAQITLNPECE